MKAHLKREAEELGIETPRWMNNDQVAEAIRQKRLDILTETLKKELRDMVVAGIVPVTVRSLSEVEEIVEADDLHGMTLGDLEEKVKERYWSVGGGDLHRTWEKALDQIRSEVDKWIRSGGHDVDEVGQILVELKQPRPPRSVPKRKASKVSVVLSLTETEARALLHAVELGLTVSGKGDRRNTVKLGTPMYPHTAGETAALGRVLGRVRPLFKHGCWYADRVDSPDWDEQEGGS